MKHYLQLALFTILFCSFTLSTYARTDCSGYQSTYPDHYCDCYVDNQRINSLDALKDLHFNDSIWFKTSSNTFTQAGMTAYLFSESDVQVKIFQKCTSQKTLFATDVPKNQTRDMDHQSILDKMAQNGGTGANMTIYVLFYPTIEGADCRLMCYPYNQGPNSTPEAPLPMLVGMTYVSSHAYDVYELKAESIPASRRLYTQWNEPSNLSCHLRITRGTVDGETIAEYDFLDATDYYHFSTQLLEEVAISGESLYLHFTHDAAAAGRIVTQAIHINDILTHIEICQGKSWIYDGVEYTQSVLLPYDTVWTSEIAMDLYQYDVQFLAPELQYDTLALLSTDLPYNYRGEVLADYGDYELFLQAPDQCDEHIQLHAYHHITTITNVIDTSFCSVFEYDGKTYDRDVEIVSEHWLNADTLVIDTIRARYAEWDIIYDTLGLKLSEVPNHYYRYNANSRIDIPGYGDFEYDIYKLNLCPATLYLHVYRSYEVESILVDTTLCQGLSYVHHNGAVYTTSTVIHDTLVIDDEHLEVTSTRVHFTTPEIQYDTLALRAADLPYQYLGHTLTDYGHYDLLLHTDGECDEQVSLYAYHDIDTLTQVIDTVICYGKVFEYQGTVYTEPDVLTDTIWLNADTCQHLTIRIWFAEIEQVYDTLGLKTTDLPYNYHGQTITDFGHYEFHLQDSEGCEQLIDLTVYHAIDTIRQLIDTVVCQGKVFEYNGMIYTESNDWVDTVWINADTYHETTIHLLFQAPDLQYDTLGLKTTDLPHQYRGEEIAEFGDYDLILHTEGECDEHIQLHVYHQLAIITSAIDTVICYGGSFLHNGTTYTKDVVIIDERPLNADTLFVDTLHVYFDTEPALRYDTLGLKSYDLPYRYHRQTINDYGDYEFDLTTSAGCKEHVLLHVYHDVAVIHAENDTTLCQGKQYVHNSVSYSEDVTLVDSLWLDADSYQMTTTHVWFAEPEMEYDTVTVTTADLQAGYYYVAADTYIYHAGTYSYVVEKADECTRHITLTVIEDTTSAVENTMVEEQLQLILEDGVVYVLKDGEKYTLMGERL